MKAILKGTIKWMKQTRKMSHRTHCQYLLPCSHLQLHRNKDDVGEVRYKINDEDCQNGQSHPCEQWADKIAATQ